MAESCKKFKILNVTLIQSILILPCALFIWFFLSIDAKADGGFYMDDRDRTYYASEIWDNAVIGVEVPGCTLIIDRDIHIDEIMFADVVLLTIKGDGNGHTISINSGSLNSLVISGWHDPDQGNFNGSLEIDGCNVYIGGHVEWMNTMVFKNSNVRLSTRGAAFDAYDSNIVMDTINANIKLVRSTLTTTGGRGRFYNGSYHFEDSKIGSPENPFRLNIPGGVVNMRGNSTLYLEDDDCAFSVRSINDPSSIEIESPVEGVIAPYINMGLNTIAVYTDQTLSTVATSAVLKTGSGYTANNNGNGENGGNGGNGGTDDDDDDDDDSSNGDSSDDVVYDENDFIAAFIRSHKNSYSENYVTYLRALTAFENKTINDITNAPQGGTITIETNLWNSLGRNIRDAMMKRPDVTVKVSFLSEGYKGIPLKVTIPAGRTDLFDKDGYLGLCRAGNTLGYDN